MEVLPVQDHSLVAAAHVQYGALTVAALGEEQVQAKAVGSVPYLDLPPLLLGGESVLDGAFDVKVLDVAFALSLAQRDKHVPAVSLLIAVHSATFADPVLGEYLTVAPGMVLEGDDVVLQELDPLMPFEDGGLALGVFEVQGGVVIEDLVHALGRTAGQRRAQRAQRVQEVKCGDYPLQGERGEEPAQ